MTHCRSVSDALRSRPIVGLATDYCIVHTAHSALQEGLAVTVETAGIRGINERDAAQALADLRAWGAIVR